MAKKVLVVGRDKEMTLVVERVLNKMEDYSGLACFDVDGLKAILVEKRFHILLIGAGFSAAEEKLLEKEAKKIFL